MKKIMRIVICFLLFISLAAKADKPKVNGYYVDNNQDTIKVLMEIPLEFFNKKIVAINLLQFGFKYFEKGKEFKITDRDALAFGFTFAEEKFIFQLITEISIPIMGNMHPKGIFARLLEGGSCNLYFVTTVDGRTTEHFFRRGTNDFYLTKDTKSASRENKDLEKYFSDCPALATKIINNEYKGDKEKYYNIAKYYNKLCKSDEPTQAEE
jgi:hypothetical protein